MQQNKAWAGTTYGNNFMHTWLIRMLKYVDVRILYVFTSAFIVPVCLIKNNSCGIIFRYFRKIHQYSWLKAAWKTYVNHCKFSQAVIDKFAMYAGKKFNVEIEGYDKYLHLAQQNDGFIQLSSHIGNYEIAGYTLTASKKPFNALVFAGEKDSVMENRNKMFASTNIHLIPVKNDMSHLFLINDALQKGETISMPADRMLGSSKSLSIEFLGKKALFPLGPFSVATMKGLEVITVNVMKTSTLSYKIYVNSLRYDKTVSRKEQIQELFQNYVKVLEQMVREYPEQWYNFYEFWTEI